MNISTGEPSIEVSIIIVSFNTREVTLECLRSIDRHMPSVAFEVIVLDNCSTDGSADAIEAAYPEYTLIRLEENVGFAAGNNIATQYACGDYVLFLNPDTELLASSVDNLLKAAKQHSDAGAWGGRTLFADHTLNPSSLRAFTSLRGLLFSACGASYAFKRSSFFNPDPYPGFLRDRSREVDILFFCFVMMKRDMWERLGGFDTRFFMFCEDDDVCFRIRQAGYPIWFTPDAVVIHHGGVSIPNSSRRAVAILKARVTFVDRHWSSLKATMARLLLRTGIFIRMVASAMARGSRAQMWREVWERRNDWLVGYPERNISANANVRLPKHPAVQ
ncbi:MAG: glycosyltransferase family 2 protein [Pseudomonadota bacterium]